MFTRSKPKTPKLDIKKEKKPPKLPKVEKIKLKTH